MLKHVAATRTILSCQHTVNELWNILKMTCNKIHKLQAGESIKLLHFQTSRAFHKSLRGMYT